MSDETIDVTGAAPSATPDTSQSEAAPTSGAEGAVPQPQADESSAAPSFTVPETDDDLKGRESQPYAQGVLELRKGFRELNGKYTELQSQYTPVMQELERFGGLETAIAAAELAAKLFQPTLDEMGQMVTDQRTGLPLISSEGFVQHIASQNWDTALDMTEHLLMLPTATGEPLIYDVLRRGLGLDPNKLDLYRSINSQADAAARGLLDVTPEELYGIPEQYHATYSRLGPKEREAVQDLNLSEGTRIQMMDHYARAHQMEDYIRQQQAGYQQEQQRREQEYVQQVESWGDNQAVTLWSTHETALKEELGKIQWGADATENAMVNDLIGRGVAQYVNEDPKVGPMRQQAYELVMQAARAEAMGNRMQANQARIHAYRIGQQIAGHARIYMTKAVEALQRGRGMVPANGAARPVINSAGQNGPGGGRSGWTIPEGIKPFSQEYFDALEGRSGR
jgi:hypothetical protein